MKSTVPLLHIKGFGGCDCGSKVIDVGVEAVLSRKEVDRRVLSANFDEALGLTICKGALFTHSAKQRSTPWIGASFVSSRLQ